MNPVLPTSTAGTPPPVAQANAAQNPGAPVNNSSASTISSAAPAQNRGVFAQIQNVIAKFFSSTRDCLARLPLIGWCFKRSEPGPVTPNALSVPTTDAGRLSVLRTELKANGAADADTARDLDQAAQDNLVSVFAEITDPVIRSEAFHVVLNARNSTDAMARQCFDALPQDAKEAFQRHCFEANGRSQIFNGHDHQGHVGAHIAYEQIRSEQAITAANAYHAALAIAATNPPPASAPVLSARAQLRNLVAALNNTSVPAADVAARTALIRTAFDALTPALQNQIKAQIWNLNNRTDVIAPHDYSHAHGTFGNGIGAFVVGYDVLDVANGADLFKRAAQVVLSSVNNA